MSRVPSGKDGQKAEHVKRWCQETGRSFVRYDPTCLGASPGDWSTVELQDWRDDAGEVLEKVCGGPTVLLGSSMGGWISLLLATNPRYQELISGMVLVAPAINFFRPHYKQIVSGLPPEERARLEQGEVVVKTDDTGFTTHLRWSWWCCWWS